MPHQETRVKSTTSEVTGLTITINKNGNCAAPGDEFNPLKEVDQYGNPNPYQDPTRGRIAAKTAPDGETSTMLYNFQKEDAVLQNLAGPDSLIGRSLTVVSADELNGPQTYCCVIGRNAPPTVVVTDDDDGDDQADDQTVQPDQSYDGDDSADAYDAEDADSWAQHADTDDHHDHYHGHGHGYYSSSRYGGFDKSHFLTSPYEKPTTSSHGGF